MNLDAVVLAEADEEHDASLEHQLPGVMVRKLQTLIFVCGAFAKQYDPWILPAKVGAQIEFERAAEEHRRAGILLLPAIEVAVPIPPGTGP